MSAALSNLVSTTLAPLLAPYVARTRAALDKLAPRERLLVVTAAAVLGVLILYLAIWEPLVKAHQRRSEALADARALAQRIETAAALASSRRGAGGDRNANLLAVIDQSSRQPVLGKAPSRVQPDGSGDKSVKIWFEDVPFDNLLRWLGELQTRYEISVASAEISRGAAPGAVSAQLTLSR